MLPKPKFSKESIIETALKLIEEKGYKAFSVHEIAKKMKSSTQPIYTNFDSFQDLKEEVLR